VRGALVVLVWVVGCVEQVRDVPTTPCETAPVVTCDGALTCDDSGCVCAVDEACQGCLSASGECVAFPSEAACSDASGLCRTRPGGTVCFDDACRVPCQAHGDCPGGAPCGPVSCRVGFCYADPVRDGEACPGGACLDGVCQ
jgi:hypothetical protein